jgi:16S rRNA C967 or C1407 C5-methylase (RsmB/RsmF family)
MIGIRINTLKVKLHPAKEALLQIPGSKEVTWAPELVLVPDDMKSEIQASHEYQNGLLYFQNPASLLPAYVLNPQPEETILDLCAAPGSKTTHIAALMKNTGTIIANDVQKNRMFKLKAVTELLGAYNVSYSQRRGEFMGERYPEYFDRVLVDAPCSMGEDLKSKKIDMLRKRQFGLLRSAIEATVPGGTIVYSTCTQHPKENQGVITDILKKVNSIKVVPIEIEGLPKEWITPEGYISITGNDTYEPFFVAKCIKC